jgi:hypothetical protein
MMHNDTDTWPDFILALSRCTSCGQGEKQHERPTGKCFFGPGNYTKNSKPDPTWTLRNGPK